MKLFEALGNYIFIGEIFYFMKFEKKKHIYFRVLYLMLITTMLVYFYVFYVYIVQYRERFKALYRFNKSELTTAVYSGAHISYFVWLFTIVFVNWSIKKSHLKLLAVTREFEDFIENEIKCKTALTKTASNVQFYLTLLYYSLLVIATYVMSMILLKCTDFNCYLRIFYALTLVLILGCISTNSILYVTNFIRLLTQEIDDVYHAMNHRLSEYGSKHIRYICKVELIFCEIIHSVNNAFGSLLFLAYHFAAFIISCCIYILTVNLILMRDLALSMTSFIIVLSHLIPSMTVIFIIGNTGSRLKNVVEEISSIIDIITYDYNFVSSQIQLRRLLNPRDLRVKFQTLNSSIYISVRKRINS